MDHNRYINLKQTQLVFNLWWLQLGGWTILFHQQLVQLAGSGYTGSWSKSQLFKLFAMLFSYLARCLFDNILSGFSWKRHIFHYLFELLVNLSFWRHQLVVLRYCTSKSFSEALGICAAPRLIWTVRYVFAVLANPHTVCGNDIPTSARLSGS